MSNTSIETLNKVMSLKNEVRDGLNKSVDAGPGDHAWKFLNFPVHVPRQAVTRFLSRYEIFKEILTTHGSIVECGVFGGFGAMTWHHLSSIFEPLNFSRQIIGFDTFSGFPSMAPQDREGSTGEFREGDLSLDSYQHLINVADVHAQNMLIPMPQKLKLVKGDATKTIPKYLKDHPETVVSLLYLDFDIYEPTKTALEVFLPRMPKGSIIAFDELNDPTFPGETLAVVEKLGLNNLRLKRFAFDTKVSYAVIE